MPEIENTILPGHKETPGMLYTKYHRLLQSFAISVSALYLNSKLFSIIFPLIQGFDDRRSIAIILHTGNIILRMDIGFIFCIIVLTAILFKARRFSSRLYAITMVFLLLFLSMAVLSGAGAIAAPFYVIILVFSCEALEFLLNKIRHLRQLRVPI